MHMTVEKIRDSIASFEQNALEHLGRIKDPTTYGNYQQYITQTVQEQQYTLQNWYKQAAGFIEKANVYRGYLNELLKN